VCAKSVGFLLNLWLIISGATKPHRESRADGASASGRWSGRILHSAERAYLAAEVTVLD